MILNMASKLEEYHHPESAAYQQYLASMQQQQSLSSAGALSAAAALGAVGANSQIQGKESIHSGQFMVSHFEANAEAQEDEDEDSEIKMPDPNDPNLEKVEDVSLCTEVQLYVPQKLTETGSTLIVTSHLEIETSLTKLFKCMNLAYSQKLTSPKWNHFKGVRLRWKDKIRLNNVIWRCWHMQFILKKRTPVCQFASPLDVDIHSNPQSVLLEGKYWKRQLSVIKAEYRKWRRHFKTRVIGSQHCDSRSDFDFLEWSPLPNEKSLTLGEDWTSDSLFSAINGPFPFPDPREIARGAGIADFIQPSLGPLQPNLDELDVTFQELLESTRLPPVPEEGTEDLLKSVESVQYNYPAIMGTEQMDSSNMMDVTLSGQTENISETMQDTNMLELNTPLEPISLSDKMYEQNIEMQSPQSVLGSQDSPNINLLNRAQFTSQMMNTNQTTNLLEQNKGTVVTIENFSLSSNTGQLSSLDSGNSMSGSVGKNILKGRISKNVTRPFRRREPHNYDKAQPTLHQTTIYQQMLAEQHQQHQQQQIHQQAVQAMQFSQSLSNPNLSTNAFGTQSTNLLNITNNQNLKNFSAPQTLQNISINNIKFASTQSEILSLLNISNLPQDTSKAATSLPHQGSTQSSASFKPYPSPQVMKKAASTAGYISMPTKNLRHPSPPGSKQATTLVAADQHTSQILSQKEMFRSNSLPLNSSLQKIEPKEDNNFAVPAKYNLKGNRSRTRSNSVQQQSAVHSSPLQTATSEPMLNSTLAQLLTTNSNKLHSKHASSGNILSTSPHQLPPLGFATSAGCQSNIFQSIAAQNSSSNSCSSLSPIKSTSLPLMMHSPPGNKMLTFPPPPPSQPSPNMNLSPESFTDQESPLSPTRSSTSSSKYPKDSQRRAGHIHAEQKRRCNIKNGFDMLHSLIPQLQQNPNGKLSKAALLQKGAEYIKQLKIERKILSEKMDSLRKERDNLNNSLSHLHSILPANGAPVSRQRTERVKQLYYQYVRFRTMENWKFWILGLILEPLLNSYTTTVSMASIEELYRTALLWVEQNCSLIELRPAVSNKLRYLSMTTDILSDPPSIIQEEVMKAINNPANMHPNLSGS